MVKNNEIYGGNNFQVTTGKDHWLKTKPTKSMMSLEP